jgi:hypothetical protein
VSVRSGSERSRNAVHGGSYALGLASQRMGRMHIGRFGTLEL